MELSTILGVLIIAKWLLIAHLIEKLFQKLYNETTGDYVRREWFGQANSNTGATTGD